MFSGIISAVGTIKTFQKKGGSAALVVEKPRGWKVQEGDSISIDGVCLTINTVGARDLTTILMDETLKKTTFGLSIPKKVNLEQSLRLSDQLSGHMVLGHVDCVGKIRHIALVGDSKVFTVSFPEKFGKYVVAKGSIAIDGISLTIVNVGKDWFTVSLIPYTLEHTTLGKKSVGDFVNLEFDILAKYVEKLITKQ